MKTEEIVWRAEDGFHRCDVEVVSTSGNAQFLFNSRFVGTLALCTRTELKDGCAKYKITYGNTKIISSMIDGEGVRKRVMEWMTKKILDGEAVKRIEFEYEYVHLDMKTIEITIK